MNTDKLGSWIDQAQPILLAFGLKVLGAIAVFIVGRWLIGMATRLVGAAMTRQKLDPTVQRYLVSLIAVALNIILVVAILGYFGVETTSFAALVAGAGVAIGAAWSGDAIREEVASAQDLQRILHRPDERGEIERRIDRATGHSLAARHGSEGGDRDHRPEERNRSDELPRYPSLSVAHRAC